MSFDIEDHAALCLTGAKRRLSFRIANDIIYEMKGKGKRREIEI